MIDLLPARGSAALPTSAPAAGPRRRILLVHNRYQVRGGEDAVVERETDALHRAGQIVETLIVSNDAIRTRADRLRTAAQAVEAPQGIATVLDAVARFRPHVVHVHNTFPLISPAVHAAVRATGAATVQTLHNFRVTCANAQLLRAGAPCEDCVTGSPYNAVLHGCYRDSRLGSLAVARMIDHHRRAGTWSRDVDRFIALTAFSRDLFVRAGLPADRIVVKPNGLPDPGRPMPLPRRGILYVGRLSAEKGVATLARAAPLAGTPITVIGEGPLGQSLVAPNLTLLGPLPRDDVAAAMTSALAVVVPSLWYEGLPMVVAEAFAAGTPVIASRLGNLAEIVEDGVTGLLVRPGDAADLARACDWIAQHPAEALRMGRAARAAFERLWAEPVTTAALLDVYAQALAARRLEGALS